MPLVLYSLWELDNAFSLQWIFFFFCCGSLAWTAVIWNKHWQASRHIGTQEARQGASLLIVKPLLDFSNGGPSWSSWYHGGPFWSACVRQKSAHRWSTYLCPSSARTPFPLYPFWSSSACKTKCVQRQMCAASSLLYNSKPLASRLLLVICH